MVQARGIEVFQKDTMEPRVGSYLSWQCEAFDRWFVEFIGQHPELPCEDIQLDANIYEFIIPQELLRMMAEDLLSGNYHMWSDDDYDFVVLTWDMEDEYVESFGKAFLRLVNELQEDEVLVCYRIEMEVV